MFLSNDTDINFPFYMNVYTFFEKLVDLKKNFK